MPSLAARRTSHRNRAATARGLRRYLPPFFAALLPLVSGCGRIGYDLLPSTVHSKDASSESDATGAGGAGSRDASIADGRTGGVNGTGGAPSRDAGTGGASGSTGSPDAGIRDGATDGARPRCAIPVQSVADYCVELPQLENPATIDGVLDCGLSLHPLTPLGWTGGATLPDATAEYAVAWRPDGLYFFVAVQDPLVVAAPATDQIWEGDGIEIFVDDDGTYLGPPGYDNPGTRQFTTAAPSSPTDSAARGQIWAFPLPTGLPADWLSPLFRVFPTPGGYTLEAFVAGADLGLPSWTPSAGARVGIDVAVDVSYPEADASGADGHRLGQYFLSVDQSPPDAGASLPFVNSNAFCNPTLVTR